MVNPWTPSGCSLAPVSRASTIALSRAANRFGTQLTQSLRGMQPVLVVNPEARDLGALLAGELFRAQMRLVATRAGTKAPRFPVGWAADRDLLQPMIRALDTRIFLTRNQLNQLAQHVQVIAEETARANSPQQLFERLQSLSAAASTDPVRFGANFQSISQSNLLPAYLRLLPYRSKVLNLSQASYESMGATGQAEFLDELRTKLTAYRQINERIEGWRDLGSGERGLQVFPIPLELLP